MTTDKENMRDKVERLLKEFLPIRDYQYITDSFIGEILCLLEPKMSEGEIEKIIESCKFQSGIQNEDYEIIYPKQLAKSLASKISKPQVGKMFPISACCNSSVKLYGEGDLQYYRCEVCGNVCDLSEDFKPQEFCECKEPKEYYDDEEVVNKCRNCDKPIRPTEQFKQDKDGNPIWIKPEQKEYCECWEKLEPGLSLPVDQVNPPICAKCHKEIKFFKLISAEKKECECKEPKYYVNSLGVYQNFCVQCRKPINGTIGKPIPAEKKEPVLKNSICDVCKEICKATHPRYACALFNPICSCGEPKSKDRIEFEFNSHGDKHTIDIVELIQWINQHK